MKNRSDPGGITGKPPKRARPLALTAAVMLAVMTAFEAAKQLIHPGIAIWESHTVTIVFSTAVAVSAAYVILKRRDELINALSQDITERKRAEENLDKSWRTQAILNELLRISLQDVPLVGLLDQALDTILAAPFMPLQPKGGIFLVEGESPELT